MNTVVGAIIAAPAAIPVLKFGGGDAFDYFLMWLGVSVAMHSFPSTGDAASIWKALKRPNTSIFTKIFGFPIIGIIYLGAIGSMVWLDLLWGVGVAGFLPNLIIKAIA